MRKRGGCLSQAAEFIIGMIIFSASFAATVYVHVNVPAWEAPAVFISLVPGLLATFAFFRTKRHSWVFGIIGGLLLAFSFGLALFHGWKDQALAIVYIGMGVLVVFGIVLITRMSVRRNRAMRTLGESAQAEARLHGDVLFRDDGERITVYPNRRRLFIQCILQALMLGIIGAVLAFIRIGNVLALGAFIALAVILALVSLAVLYRLLVHRPALVVGPDGLFDNASLLAAGLGLLRWDEILSVAPIARTSSGVGQRYLRILVPDGRAIRKRQPFWKRLALLLIWVPSWEIDIWSGMLTTPLDDLTQQITRYVATHAPADWQEGEADGEGEATSPPPEAS